MSAGPIGQRTPNDLIRGDDVTFPPQEQSPNPPPPGWWLASDGRWYPPELHPAAAPPPLAPTNPISHSPLTQPAGTWSSSRATGQPDFVTTSRTERPSRRPRASVVLAIAGVLIVGSTVCALSRPRTAPSQPDLAAGIISPGTSGSSTTSTSPAPTNPVTLAKQVGFQPGDLAQGWSPVANTQDIVSTPSAPGPCSPVSGAPWLADVSSTAYQDSSGWTAFSEVVVMPDAAHAQAAVAAIDAPDYAHNCFQPAWDQWAKQGIADADAQSTSCSFSFVGSSIGAAPALAVPSGATGIEYQAQISCPTEGPSTLTRDEVSTTVGNLFLQVQFLGEGTPPTVSESTSLSNMVQRARQATDSS
jgi:hypothetical protein